jgi:ribosomal protein L28
MIGHNVSHAKNRTRKVFKPNLHNARILVGSNYKRMRLCTKCLRLLKAATKPKNFENKVVESAPVINTA